MHKLAILHTTVMTVAPLQQLAAELIPGVEVINFVDDSILPQLLETDGDITKVAHRITQYARFAQDVGAHVILEACSSVGEVVEIVQQCIKIPIVRIDEAMAELAVQQGDKIIVAATLFTTLRPTLHLLQDKARQADRIVELQPLLISAAYEKLLAGDQVAYDAILQEQLAAAARLADLIVLAQASMAKAITGFDHDLQRRFLTSPRFGMERVKQVLATLQMSSGETR